LTAEDLTASDLQERVKFDIIRYANCWEDADVLCEALRPAPGKRIVSVASGGDNSLALAAEGATVIAADLSPAQLACVELKCAAIRHLEHPEVLAFLGVRESQDRLATYAALEGGLSEEARAFWRGRSDALAGGFIHAGKFESYFSLFRRRVIPLIHTTSEVEELLREKDEAARLAFYERTWNNLRWKLMFRVFFSRFVMGRLGRDPEFFRYVEGAVSERILSRARYALTALPTHSNPFLCYILTGNFTRSLPRYLEPERFEAVRDGLSRLTLFPGSVQDAARAHGDGGFDGFNLSDIFEYLDPPTCVAVFDGLLSVARSGARLAYWNMLAPRRCPDELVDRVTALDELADELLGRDKAFFYSAFVVEEVN
jgi:S-adenosylmethionine-diacylglycerol 3-amino-3-carboxypropyl transferase